MHPVSVTAQMYDACSVYAIDVDSDGDVDVVAASPTDGEVAWFENEGLQPFTKPSLICENQACDTVRSQAWFVYAIDVDGDGDVDVLSAIYGSDEVLWDENDGSQSFTTHIINTSGEYGATGVFALDMDGDGDVDVLSTNYNRATVAWYENDCGTSFPTSSPVPSTLPTALPSSVPSSAPTHTPCAPGSSSATLSGAGCVPCLPGTFANRTGATSCDICAVNT